ncbi:MAG: 2-hydroxymuconate tautomerase [Dehalococcoidia bacterium]|nr:2-hydroxymuconate tautomerase [Dehalococcoidia bacterium]
MPIIRVEMFPGRTKEQKAKLAEAITQVMVDIGGAPRDHTWVVFREEPKENWAIGGKLSG